MKTGQLMMYDVEFCRQDDSLYTAAGTMRKHNIGCLPVINASRNVIGMITDRDICMAAYDQRKLLENISVSSAMSNIVCSCQASDTIEKAEQIMRMNMVKRLPVVDAEGKLVGILSLSDIAQEAEREVIASNHEISAQEVTATMASISHSKNRRILS